MVYTGMCHWTGYGLFFGGHVGLSFLTRVFNFVLSRVWTFAEQGIVSKIASAKCGLYNFSNPRSRTFPCLWNTLKLCIMRACVRCFVISRKLGPNWRVVS